MGKPRIFLLAFLCLGALQAQKRIKGNGNVVTIERNTGDYDALRIGGFYEVELVDGPEGKITLKGEENILDYTETQVRGGTLTIKSRDNKNLIPSRGETVFITVPIEQINTIRLSGSGKVTGRKRLGANDFRIRTSGSRNLEVVLDAQSLTVTTSGSSSVRVQGSAEDLEVISSGSSNFGSIDLMVDRAKFTASGSSNGSVTVNESIHARVSGSANITYGGNPKKEHTKSSGSGRITKK